MSTAVVEVLRGGLVESVHRVHVAVADGVGRLRGRAGEPDTAVLARSAVKPIQAVPLVEEGVVGSLAITEVELALCCASHSGEPHHVRAAAGLLERVGLDEHALACGAHAPFHAPSAEALRALGQAPSRLHNNCSGKHAGMLALAAAHGWPLRGYHGAEHPVQLRMLQEVSRWSGIATDAIDVAVDGCGVSTFALPLRALALTFARLSIAGRSSESAPARLVRAMTAWPELVGGTDRLCTELMRAARGRIFAKVGAEGVYCAGVPGAEIGIALKVEDGAKRAAEPALIEVLRLLGLLTDEDMGLLDRYARPDVVNTRGEVVGCIRADMMLETSNG
jgi:L-asparaginase II